MAGKQYGNVLNNQKQIKMINDIRYVISLKIMMFAFKVMPANNFKKELAKTIVETLTKELQNER